MSPYGPYDVLRDAVTGKVERGEAEPIVEQTFAPAINEAFQRGQITFGQAKELADRGAVVVDPDSVTHFACPSAMLDCGDPFATHLINSGKCVHCRSTRSQLALTHGVL